MAKNEMGRTGASPWNIGEVLLNQFRIDAILGRGNYGTVFRVYDLKDHGFMAVKTFRDRYVRNQGVVDQFVEEAKVWVDLGGHENIVQAAFVQVLRGRPCIFMEYVVGTSLAPWIGTKRMDFRMALELAVQFCEGMTHATARIPGIVHQDIKPGNTLLALDGTLKITDWGLAKTVRSGKNVPCGTLPYMAPEQFTDPVSVDTRSDIYSFGVMLYEMLAGHLPLLPEMNEDFTDRMRYLHLKVLPERPCKHGVKVPRAVEDIAMACLRKHASDRPQSFGQLLSDLRTQYRGHYGTDYFASGGPKPRGYRELCNEAASLIDLKEFRKAVDACRKAIDLDEQSPQAWVNLGIAWEKLRSYKDALGCYDRALGIDEKLEIAWNNRGNTLSALGRTKDAICSFDRAISLNSNYDRAWNNKGWVLLDTLGRYQDALECFTRATQIDPFYDDAWNHQGMALARLGEHTESLKRYDRALLINPRSVAVLSNRAGSLCRLRRYTEAIESCDRALEIEPCNYNALNNRGLALNGANRTDQALISFDKAILVARQSNGLIDPDAALVNKGDTLVELNMIPEAITCYEEAIRLNGSSADYFAKLGYAYTGVGDPEQARSCFEAATELDPADAMAHYNLASVEAGLQNLDRAIAEFKEAIRLQRDFAEAHCNLGATLHQKGLYRDAIRAYEDCISIDPGHAKAYNNLGLSQVQLGYEEQAVMNYKKAIALYPGYADAHYNLAIRLMSQGADDLAKVSLLKAVESNPRHYRALNNLCAIEFNRGNLPAAKKYCEMALAVKPDLEIARINLHTILRALQDMNER